jgi:hypothetical protein
VTGGESGVSAAGVGQAGAGDGVRVLRFPFESTAMKRPSSVSTKKYISSGSSYDTLGV